MDSKCHVHSFICWLINVPSLMNYILFITSCVKLSVEEFANELLVDKFIQRRLFVETWLYMTICSIVRTPRKCQWQSAFQLHSMRLQLTCLVSHEQLISFFLLPFPLSSIRLLSSFFFHLACLDSLLSCYSVTAQSDSLHIWKTFGNVLFLVIRTKASRFDKMYYLTNKQFSS